MVSKEHTYAILDTTTVSLRLLCGYDFPDAVPFHVTEMACSPSTDTGRQLLRTHFHTSRTTAQPNKYYEFFLSIMAWFLDQEEEWEFIDISSTSDSQQGSQARAVGGAGLPSPPHQPPIEVSATISKHGTLVALSSLEVDTNNKFPF